MKYLIPSAFLALTLLLPGEAVAHNRHRHRHNHHYHGGTHLQFACYHGDCRFGFGSHYHRHRYEHRPHRVRISRDCVYKPHKDKVVCKY